jgi:SAM-dependent methyltransferase
MERRLCHTERSEASRCPSRETLRGVYPQRRAQRDKVVPILMAKLHYGHIAYGIIPLMTDNNPETPQHNDLGKVLQNQQAVDFVRAVVKENYREFFTGHEEVAQMVNAAFDLLEDSQRTQPENERLQQAVATINQTIFRKGDSTFWFNTMYHEYKTRTRPHWDFSRLHPFLQGTTILDYGSGGGYLALELERHGYQVLTTDVLDYRVPEARHLPFRRMTSPVGIPYPDTSADTTIVKAVLHHIAPSHLSSVLEELRRVSQRIIIEEDTYDVPQTLHGVEELARTQPQFARFHSLSARDQFESLMLIDYFANAVAQGLVEMNFPFQFKTIPQWIALLEEHDLNVTQIELLGFQPGNVNRSCHVWFICDRNNRT